jgi:hypothetical protein
LCRWTSCLWWPCSFRSHRLMLLRRPC